jgi:dTDP-4-dehydrorhamnose reductase
MTVPVPRTGNWFVTGASGMLGTALCQELLDRGATVAAAHNTNPLLVAGVSAVSVDLTVAESAAQAIAQSGAQIVVNCAAITSVDYCEMHPDEAQMLNADAVASLAMACNEAGAMLLHVSTDAVFSGSRGGGYTEADTPSAVGVYARTKLAGETGAGTANRHLVVRTNMFGWHPRPGIGLAEWIVGRLRAGQQVPGFTDVTFSPLLVNHLAAVLVDLVAADATGLLHVGAADSTTKYDFAKCLAETLEVAPDLVVPALSTDAGLAVPRGSDTSLNSKRAQRLLGRHMPTIRDGVEGFRALGVSGYLNRAQPHPIVGTAN